MRFDALLVLSFGGPEAAEDVMPFLRNVVRGRDVPEERLEQVASQYMRLGGRSPINDANRALVAALRRKLDRPVYWGNRNWKPCLGETVARMRADGIASAAVFATSAYSSYSGCGQYLHDMARARVEAGDGAPELVKLRPFFDHPGFVEPLAEGLAAAVAGPAAADAPVLMTAHSLPVGMADACDYRSQLARTARLVAEMAGVDQNRCRLVYQSRSGPPSQPWLGPDIGAALAGLPPGTGEVVVVPIGFVSDHMEVVHDLDLVAAAQAAEKGVRLVRTPTPGRHPSFVRMVADLLEEAEAGDDRWPVPCKPGCCPPGPPVDSSG